ncbi:MAG: MBL fold metallo-hydrolase, partial [Elusimicrobiaceae bacterium]
MAKLTFAGAAGEVTGSRHILHVGGKNILLDCGLFQGHRQDAENKNRNFLFKPGEIDAVVLSHAHLDHIGALPRLVKQKFKGRIFCTPPTAQLVSVLLEDSANIQESDARFYNKKHPQNPIEPLYKAEDIAPVEKLLTPFKCGEFFEPVPGVTARFIEAGHILGSAQVELSWQEDRKERKLVYTGDLGRQNMPLLKDPQNPFAADTLIMESTYGNRLHEDIANSLTDLKNVILKTVKRGGKIFIPAFALGRVQEIAAALEELHRRGDIGRIPVFVDSPLAGKTTKIFAQNTGELDEEFHKLADVTDPFGHGWVKYVSEQADSVRLNEMKVPAVIVSPSGMCEGGRILHHLRNNISNPRNTVILVGYQAQGTLGKKIFDRAPSVKIYGHEVKVQAEIGVIEAFSAHG